MDEDGYLFITGRTKDLIIRGGENIAPGEIEDVLEQHPAVEEAAVIGVPDVEWGEVVKAIVVAKGDRPSPDDLTSFVKGKLASYKAPKYYAFVDELPRNYLGKVLKTELRKQYGQATGAADSGDLFADGFRRRRGHSCVPLPDCFACFGRVPSFPMLFAALTRVFTWVFVFMAFTSAS